MKWPAPQMKEQVDQPRRLRGMPFKTLLTPLLLILALAIIATGWGTYYVHQRVLRESLIEQAEERAHNSYMLVQKHLQQQFEQLHFFNQSLIERKELKKLIFSVLTSPFPEQQKRSLLRHLEDNRHLLEQTDIFLFDHKGEPIFPADTFAGALKGDPKLVLALKGQVESGLFYQRDQWVAFSAMPLVEKENVYGVLVSAQRIARLLAQVGAEQHVELALIDTQGRRTGDFTGQINPTAVAAVLQNNQMQTRSSIDLKQLIHYMGMQIGQYSFALVSHVNLNPILNLLEKKRQEVLQFTLVLLLILVPLSALGVRFLLRPLNQLRDRAESLALELTGNSLQEQQGHEISKMVTTFDAMAELLKAHEAARLKAEARLQQEHASLEIKVRDRTLELMKTNDLLQREVSERTYAQQKAEGLQSLLSSLIDSMPSGLIGIDREDRIIQWNLEIWKLVGLSFDDVRNRNLFEVLPQLAEIQAALEDTQQNGKPNKISRLPWYGGNTKRLVDIVIYPLGGTHQGGAVLRIDDGTNQALMEERMIQSEKMMSVGGLAAGMAHEINNPLASIIQGVQVISQRISPELSKNRNCAEEVGIDLIALNNYLKKRQVRQILGSILDAGQRAAEIVNNMLSFSHRDDAFKSPQDLSQLLERAISLATKDHELMKKYAFHRIDIKRDYASNLPECVCCPNQIQQVFFNLLQNAAQAVGSPAANISSPEIRLRLSQSDQNLLMEICDNGPGISTDIQNRIFEPFFSTKDVGEGSGLGLSVAYFIIKENHGGSIELISGPGDGGRFRILLPVGA